MKKKTVVVHSGGMDSSLCLALAIKEYGAENVLSLSFTYNQRHSIELEKAKNICKEWSIDHTIVDVQCLSEVTDNALTNTNIKIENNNKKPSTLVVGRNGLMARIAAIQGENLGAESIYMGIIEVEEANSGYRDCSRKYMDIIESALRLDFDNPDFEIKTPIVKMTKAETNELAYEMGILEFLLENTLSCYEGVEGEGCLKCPACDLRNAGIRELLKKHPEVEFSYKSKL